VLDLEEKTEKGTEMEKKDQGKENPKGKEEEVKPTKEKQADPKDTQIKDLTNTLQRLQAEFDNYRKRNEKERAEQAQFAHKQLIIQLLPTLDNFELALKNSPKENEHIKGFELIYAQLYELLEQAGVARIETLGKKFNPATMEALLQEASDKEKGTVLEELQKGYTLHGSLLRHAKVTIAKG